MNAELRFLQINVNHCADPNDEMLRNAIDKDINIVLFQDPYISGDASGGFPRGWLIFISSINTARIILTNSDYTCIESLVLPTVYLYL